MVMQRGQNSYTTDPLDGLLDAMKATSGASSAAVGYLA